MHPSRAEILQHILSEVNYLREASVGLERNRFLADNPRQRNRLTLPGALGNRINATQVPFAVEGGGKHRPAPSRAAG